jgi:hypothetical protein
MGGVKRLPFIWRNLQRDCWSCVRELELCSRVEVEKRSWGLKRGVLKGVGWNVLVFIYGNANM